MRRAVLLAALLTRALASPHEQRAPLTVAGAEAGAAAGGPTRRSGGARTGGETAMLNYIFDAHATSSKHFHDKFRAPSFEGEPAAAALEADTGGAVLFACRVAALRDKTVSWLRVSDDDDLELLTVDLETHTADPRWRADVAGEVWQLRLADARPRDSGRYGCHVSTHPPMLRRYRLTVHPPAMRLSAEAFLERGETLSLRCAVLHLRPSEPPALRWYRGAAGAAVDETRGGVLVDTDLLALTSHLQVWRLAADDAGDYTCALEAPLPLNATTRVHVLHGSSMAELQSGARRPLPAALLLLPLLPPLLSPLLSLPGSAR